MIYLDYAASTPVDDEVLNEFIRVSKEYYANPNSNHTLGMEAKSVIDEATKNIARLLNVKENEIIYTSGSSESNNLVIKGVCERYKSRGKHILISSLEHNSIVSSCTYLQELGFEVEIIPVDKYGIINIDELKKMLRDDTILVSITSVDSELGIREPIEEIASILKEYPNCFFHTDASQAIGKVNIDYSEVDLITITPHKFYGLSGVGILVKRDNVFLKPQINGGKSSTIYRSGTPDTALIASASIALKKSLENMEERRISVIDKNNRIVEYLKSKKDVTINSNDNSIPYIINFSVQNRKSSDLQKLFNDLEIYVSTKTSCCPVETPSKLVYAVTKNKSLASSSIRISLSHLTTNAEIDKFIEVMNNIIG